MECIFCNQENIENRLIFKNEYIFVIPTNIPIVPGHILVIPTRHVERIDDLNIEEQKAIFNIIPKLRKVFINNFASEGYNFAWNEGELAGQSVSHLHIHMLPRKLGDKGIIKYEPREFIYRPGSRLESPKEEIQSIAEVLRKNLKDI